MTKESTPQGVFSDSVSHSESLDSYSPKGNMLMRAIRSFGPRDENAPALERSLKSRHLNMIAMGSCIGTGLLVSVGSALRTGGPAGLVICWAIAGSMCFATIQGLGEMTVTYPVVGSFSSYAFRFLEPSVAFVIACIYTLQWFIVLPLEIIAAALTVQFWDTGMSPAAWVAIFYAIIVCINLCGVKVFGEAEFLFSSLKVMMILGFLILSIVLVCGGGPTHDFVGGRYWHNPGAFAEFGAKGVCSVFVVAAYSLGGSEMVAITAGESNPKQLPSAVKQVFWRIFLFFLCALIMIGLLVPYNDPMLLGGKGANASPFVIAVKLHNVKVLPHIMNAIILTSIISVGNACMYGASRTLCALASQNLVPKFFGYTDTMGRPLVGMGISALFGLLAFLVASSSETVVFNWLLAIVGLTSTFAWLTINVTHIRFRLAMRAQHRDVNKELELVSSTGLWGSIYAAAINIAVLGLQFWISVWPMGGKPDAKVFFQNYLCMPICLVLYVIHKVYYYRKTGKWFDFKALTEIDLDQDKRADAEVLRDEIREQKIKMAAKPLYYRIFNMFC